MPKLTNSDGFPNLEPSPDPLDVAVATMKQTQQILGQFGLKNNDLSRDLGLIQKWSSLDTPPEMAGAFAKSAYKTPRDVLETVLNKGVDGIDWKDPGPAAMGMTAYNETVNSLASSLGVPVPKPPKPGNNVYAKAASKAAFSSSPI